MPHCGRAMPRCGPRSRSSWPRSRTCRCDWPTRPKTATPATNRHRAIRWVASAPAANASGAARSRAGRWATAARRCIWWRRPTSWSSIGPPSARRARRPWASRHPWRATSGARSASCPRCACWCASTGRCTCAARGVRGCAWGSSRPRRPAGRRTARGCGRWRSTRWSSDPSRMPGSASSSPTSRARGSPWARSRAGCGRGPRRCGPSRGGSRRRGDARRCGTSTRPAYGGRASWRGRMWRARRG